MTLTIDNVGSTPINTITIDDEYVTITFEYSLDLFNTIVNSIKNGGKFNQIIYHHNETTYCFTGCIFGSIDNLVFDGKPIRTAFSYDYKNIKPNTFSLQEIITNLSNQL